MTALAHPFQYKLGDKGTMELAAYLASLGMKGLEVYHSSNNRLESMKLQEIAAACRLLPTGGSDFHGSNKPDISIGRGRGGLRVSCLLSWFVNFDIIIYVKRLTRLFHIWKRTTNRRNCHEDSEHY